MRMFPAQLDDDYQKMKEPAKISAQLFGNRFKSDQTLNEYLIEFLLVYCSAKNENLVDGKMSFHDLTGSEKLSYWVEPRMGLRRFIFYDKTRKKGVIEADELAYQNMINILKNKMIGMSDDEKDACIESIQDLFHGYAVVIKKRFWGAQALLPICPEFIVCGCDPSEKKRKKEVDWDKNKVTVDKNFDFSRRNFLARGGEVYYLHLLEELKDNSEKKERLEELLNDLLLVQCRKISKLAQTVQNSWERGMDFDKSALVSKLSLSFIPEGAYKDCSKYSVDELINYLSCNIPPVYRTELLAKGVMFQILRMLSWRVYDYLAMDIKPWIIDMKGEAKDIIKKVAAESYGNLESDFMAALYKSAREEGNLSEDEDIQIMQYVQKAKRDSLDVFRAKGKELQCIIPVKGPFQRFSLSEDVLRFLVLSLIKPGEKMTLNMFLSKLYEHYKIVIGPKEYKKSLSENTFVDATLSSSFLENEKAFQKFLKDTGFLRELSDATSIVINPYSMISQEMKE